MLQTERLILRKWTEADADSLYEYAKDPAVGPIAGWPPHQSKEESLDVIRNVLNGAECYAICENVPVPLMNDIRTKHITAMTGEEWNSLCQGGK